METSINEAYGGSAKKKIQGAAKKYPTTENAISQ